MAAASALVEVPAPLSPKPVRMFKSLGKAGGEALQDLLTGPVVGGAGRASVGMCRLWARGWLDVTDTGDGRWIAVFAEHRAWEIATVLTDEDLQRLGDGHGPVVRQVFDAVWRLRRLASWLQWSQVREVEVCGGNSVVAVTRSGIRVPTQEWDATGREVLGFCRYTGVELRNAALAFVAARGPAFVIEVRPQRIRVPADAAARLSWWDAAPYQVSDALRLIAPAVRPGSDAEFVEWVRAELPPIQVRYSLDASGQPATHTVLLTLDGIVLADHPQRDTDVFLAALTGAIQTCFAVEQRVTTRSAPGRQMPTAVSQVSLSPPDAAVRSLWVAAVFLASGYRLADVAGLLGPDGPAPDAALPWLAAGIPADRITVWIAAGATLEEALAWRQHPDVAADLAVWLHAEGITPEQVTGWKAVGMTAKNLGDWQGSPSGPLPRGEVAAWLDLGVTSYQYNRDYRLCGWQSRRSQRTPITPEEFRTWIAAGVQPREVRQWFEEVGLPDPRRPVTSHSARAWTE